MSLCSAALAFACARYEASPLGDGDEAEATSSGGCSAGCTGGSGAGAPRAGTTSETGVAGTLGAFGGSGGAGTAGASGGAQNTAGAGRANGGGGSAPDGGAGDSPVASGGAEDSLQTWSFDKDSEGWTVRDQSPKLAASLAQGSGAVELVNVPFSTTKQFVDVAYTFPAAADLRGKTLRATLQRTAGGFVGVQLYVYGGSWESPGFESLTSGDVTVVALAIDALSNAGFTPDHVSRIGMKLGTGSNTSNAFAATSIEITEVTLD